MTKAAGRLDPTARIFYRFAISAEHYARRLAAMYRPAYGISPPEWKVMAQLAQHAPMSATEAGRYTSLMPDKVTRAVDGLVSKGFVVRRLDREDKRRVVLSLSAKGSRAFADIDKARYAIESEMLARLAPEDIRALQRSLEKIHLSLRQP
ncbi:MAG TPA: MarR family transcriptional regulator [Burkholderiales bacterium]|nr:MarR family transcriptional regulator [Burkholderiales bacterium]